MGRINIGRTNWIVISLGGSLIVQGEINKDFISQFKEVIVKQINLGGRFIIVCGGGRVARDYQNAYKMIASKADNDTADLIGIKATKLNAQLVAGVFEDIADQRVIDNPSKKITTSKSIVFSGGWKPGWSTDYVAVLFAKNVGAQRIINLTNVDGVYDTDPNGENGKNAKMIFENISWNKYLAMIPKKWTPGFSLPFDPIASKEAQRKGIEVMIVNGNINNLELCLSSCKFKGTMINNKRKNHMIGIDSISIY